VRQAVVLASALAVLSAASLAAAGVRGAPPGFVRHHESKYWTWFGPAGWHSVDGVYGITVTSPSGLDGLDYGFSSVPCAATPAQFFAQRVAQVRGSIQLANLRLFNISGIGTDAAGYRQTLEFSGSSGATPLHGEITLRYALTNPPYCYASTLAKFAPSARYARSIYTLRKVWEYTYYYGPGACLSKSKKKKGAPCA
jgi:hypothetical protein